MNRVRDVRVRPDLLYVSSGWNVLITDVHGRVAGIGSQGFYAKNTRVLTRERITVDGEAPQAFTTAKVGAHALMSYAKLVDGETLPRRGVYLLVERFVGEGLRTRLTVQSYTSEVEVRFVAEAPQRTRVELEHRNIDRHGPGWESLSEAIADDAGWPLYLARYAALINGGS